MAKIELELDDKGEIIGKLPAEVDALFKRTETTGYGTGLKKGREDALTEAEKAAEARIAAEKAKWEKENPVQRVKELEEENLKFRESETTLAKRYGDTARQREETHAKEMADRAEALAKRDTQLQKALQSTIRVAALTAGAREETLDVLAEHLAKRITRDADLEPVVVADDGKPMTVQGKPVTVEAFVKSFLDQKPSFKKPVGGKGGGATGGASFHGHDGVPSKEAAIAAIETEGITPDRISQLFQATRKPKAS